MGAPIKKYGLEYTFGKNPDKIARNLKKGYLTRRDVTELVDHIKEGTAVKANFDANGKIQWMIGDDTFSPSTVTNKTPFWLRRIAYFFTPNSNKELKEKVEVIKKAYDDLIEKSDLIAQGQQAENHITILSDELEILKGDVQMKRDQVLRLEMKQMELGRTITSKSMERFDLKEALESLKEIDRTIESNIFGAWTLTVEEKFKLGKLEHTIFGDVKDRLKDKELRTSGKTILENKIHATSDEIDDKGEQLNTVSDTLVDLKKPTKTATDNLEQKQNEYDHWVATYVQQGLLVPKKEEPILVPVVEQEIKPELASSPLNYVKVLNGQKIESSPLFNQKLLYTCICNEDDFYIKSFCPALKSAALVVTSNQEDAAKLFAKWEKEIKNLAVLWKASNSENHDIDSVLLPNPYFIIESLDKINKLIASIDELKVQDFITNVSQIKIPEKLNLNLQMPLQDALKVTDYSTLFSDPAYKTWPKEVQYIAAASTLKFYTYLEALETDPIYRASSLEVLKKSVSMSPPYIATAFANLAVGSPFIFDNAIGITAKLAVPLLAPKPETEVLEHKLKFFVPNKKKVEDAIEFSKTSERKKFDKAFIAFMSSFMEDIVVSALAKHTSDDSKVGKKGKEYNLQKLILSALKNSESMNESANAMVDYLKELEKPIRNNEVLNRKKARVEATKEISIKCTLELYKSVCEVFSRSGNMQILLKQLDDKILPDIFDNPLDLENTPVHEWLQHRVLQHLL